MSQLLNRQQTALAVEQEKKLVKSLQRSDIVLLLSLLLLRWTQLERLRPAD